VGCAVGGSRQTYWVWEVEHASHAQEQAAEVEAWSGQDNGVEELDDDDLLEGQSAAPWREKVIAPTRTTYAIS